MRKEYIIKKAIEFIEKEAKERDLKVENKGAGHAFDNSFWKDIMSDDSNIPNIIAEKEGYSIELRSFWRRPEIDICDNGDLIVINYSNYILNDDGEYNYTDNYKVYEVRVDSYEYKEALSKAMKVIEFIEGE